jgi:LytS/YehU family sensor histidine kinase
MASITQEGNMITLCQVEGLIRDRQYSLARSVVKEMDVPMGVKNAISSEIFKAQLTQDATEKKDARQNKRACMIKKWHSLFGEGK